MVTMPMMGVSSVHQAQVSSLAPPSRLAMWLGVALISLIDPYSLQKMASN